MAGGGGGQRAAALFAVVFGRQYIFVGYPVFPGHEIVSARALHSSGAWLCPEGWNPGEGF